MDQQILDELSKNTFTLEAFRRRYHLLKKKLEAEIYQSEGETEAKVTNAFSQPNLSEKNLASENLKSLGLSKNQNQTC